MLYHTHAGTSTVVTVSGGRGQRVRAGGVEPHRKACVMLF